VVQPRRQTLKGWCLRPSTKAPNISDMPNSWSLSVSNDRLALDERGTDYWRPRSPGERLTDRSCAPANDRRGVRKVSIKKEQVTPLLRKDALPFPVYLKISFYQYFFHILQPSSRRC